MVNEKENLILSNFNETKSWKFCEGIKLINTKL